MKIYTKAGDGGETGLIGSGRVAKDDPRIEAYGTVDELNAVIGLARAAAEIPDEVDQRLGRIQNELFSLGAELATPDTSIVSTTLLESSHISQLESDIDSCESSLEPLTQFILPAGSAAAASLHLARVVCRRAERRVVTLARSVGSSTRPLVIQYLNRLSDLLFVLSRFVNHAAEIADVPWQKP